MLTISHSSQPDRENIHLATRRIQFRSILASTDLSAASTMAIKLAARFAMQFHAKLYTLHSIMPEADTMGVGEGFPPLEQVSVKNARADFRRYAMHIPELVTVKHEEMVVLGSPKSAIQAAVEKNSIDLLVVGSHGRHGIAKVAVGSVAEWAMNHIHCPVLVVGPRCNKTLRAISSILFASDLTLEGLRSAQYASSIAQDCNATITLMHVLSEAKTPEHGADARRTTISRLRELIPADAHEWCIPQFETETGGVAAAVLRSARTKKANLIILGARDKPVLADHAPWTTVSAIIRGAHCPVMVVPAHSA
jgi:nucleotide-binding universal stress UspA family protein